MKPEEKKFEKFVIVSIVYIYCNQTQNSRLATIPKPAINIALTPSIFTEIAPFVLEPPSPVDVAVEAEADAVEAAGVVVFVALFCNAAPTASAFAR